MWANIVIAAAVLAVAAALTARVITNRRYQDAQDARGMAVLAAAGVLTEGDTPWGDDLDLAVKLADVDDAGGDRSRMIAACFATRFGTHTSLARRSPPATASTRSAASRSAARPSSPSAAAVERRAPERSPTSPAPKRKRSGRRTGASPATSTSCAAPRQNSSTLKRHVSNEASSPATRP